MSDHVIGERITIKLATEAEGWGERIKQKVKLWAAAGLSEDVIVKKIKEACSPGGEIFESIMSGFRNCTGEAVDYITIEEVHRNWKGADSWIWISVEDADRCEDCRERDGRIQSWAEWEAEGLPGTGATVCGWRCRCSLEPSDIAADATLKK
ncbi:MAG: hypothetical protein PHD37_17235 [Gallionellaceae bacterium]|nr:hypothetical protein [Gallionellaceae bacterium]